VLAVVALLAAAPAPAAEAMPMELKLAATK
jgi:hypothetical protein